MCAPVDLEPVNEVSDCIEEENKKGEEEYKEAAILSEDRYSTLAELDDIYRSITERASTAMQYSIPCSQSPSQCSQMTQLL